MKRQFLLMLLMMVSALLKAEAQTGELPRGDAATEGVNPEAVMNWVDSLMALPDTEMHHLMVVRHGKVVAEFHPKPFDANDVHTLYSCSKTITALAIGRLIDDNRLRLDDRLAALLPEAMPDTISDDLSRVTVHNLLTMSMGIMPKLDFAKHGDDWLKSYFKLPVEEYGRFLYDSMCTFALSAIVQKLTGEKLLDYVDEKFFAPMGITVADWEESPLGINTGGYGLRLQSESLAKIGLLILHRGNWDGRQLVSERWIEQMTTAYVNYKHPGDTPTDTNQGYCYQMWRCLLPGAVRADGAFGQFIIISPEHDLVVVMNGASERTHDELRLTWQELIPGINDEPMKINKKWRKRWNEFGNSLRLPIVSGSSQSDMERVLKYRSIPVGNNVRDYKMIAPERINDGLLILKITDSFGKTTAYNLAHGDWNEPQMVATVPPYYNADGPMARSAIDGLPGRGGGFRVSGNYAWTSPTTLHCRLKWVNWITAQDIVITISDEGKVEVSLSELPR